MKICKYENIIKTLSIFLFLLIANCLLLSVAKAQGVCDFLPCEQAVDGGADSGTVDTGIERYFRYGVSLIFVGFIAFGVYIIIKAALKIIRSDGDSGQLEEGFKATKSVFIGVSMLIVGIIGLILLSVLFNAQGIFQDRVETPEGVENLPII